MTVEELARRLITLIFAGRNRMDMIHRELAGPTAEHALPRGQPGLLTGWKLAGVHLGRVRASGSLHPGFSDDGVAERGGGTLPRFTGRSAGVALAARRQGAVLSWIRWTSAGCSSEALAETRARPRHAALHHQHRSTSCHPLGSWLRRVRRRPTVCDPRGAFGRGSVDCGYPELGSATSAQALIRAGRPAARSLECFNKPTRRFVGPWRASMAR